MFQVGRYDPSSQETNAKHKGKRKKGRDSFQKRKRQQDEEQPRLQLIAPETDGPTSTLAVSAKNEGLLEEEAFDDLVPIDELIDDEDEVETSPDDANGVQTPASHEMENAKKLSELPISEAAKRWKLADFLVENLKKDGFENFFPIQALSIPDAILSTRHPHIQARDVCITAPTGSGKTLAYVLPILNTLSNRKIRRLRALVVLPSRDLALQVHQVFETYTSGSNLTVGLAIGQSNFQEEQVSLMVNTEQSDCSTESAMQRLPLEPENLSLALRAYSNIPGSGQPPRIHPAPAIDILVCTPGRLVDHIDNTPGFTLEHLRFLVVDEADRLLSQSYHNWVDRVIESANSGSKEGWRLMEANDGKLPTMSSMSTKVKARTWRMGGTAGDHSDFNSNNTFFSIASSVVQPIQLRKFLVSATLTRDPQKLESLKLVNPKHFDVHQFGVTTRDVNKYSTPENLSEFTVECTAEQKPLVLLTLVAEEIEGLVIVFTSSVDSTHRLARLLQLLWVNCELGPETAVVEFSSALGQVERSALLSRCNDGGDVSVVVCSDGMSRGMDINSVETVINYDVPVLAKTYVHRCGRTARAGKNGSAISLLKTGQVRQFQRMRGLVHGEETVQTKSIKKSLANEYTPMYRKSVRELREVLDLESKGELDHTEPISAGLQY